MFEKIQTGVIFDLLKMTSLPIASDFTSKEYFESYDRALHLPSSPVGIPNHHLLVPGLEGGGSATPGHPFF